MKENLVFLGGLPRAGSTVLCNILAQNPKLHATPTSPLVDLVVQLRRQLVENESFKSQQYDEMRRRMVDGLRGYCTGFFEKEFEAGKTVIDKSRGHIAYIEVWEEILKRKVKFIVPVRDIRAVVASFEVLYRKDPFHTWPQETQDYAAWQTTEGRMTLMLQALSPVGIAINRIKDIYSRGLQDRCFFVRYHTIAANPEALMKDIYTFLEMEPFEHDFNNIEQKTYEDDLQFGIRNLHTIRNKAEQSQTDWTKIVPDAIAKDIVNRFLWFYHRFYPEMLPGAQEELSEEPKKD